MANRVHNLKSNVGGTTSFTSQGSQGKAANRLSQIPNFTKTPNSPAVRGNTNIPARNVTVQDTTPGNQDG